MKRFLHALAVKITGQNLDSTPKDIIINLDSISKEVIVAQMNEPRPLPMGRQAFEEWTDRIISGALIPGGEDEPEAFKTSLKTALANMVMHLGPTESHKPDAFFIHSLRKGAVNQVVHAYLLEQKLAKDAAKEKVNAANQGTTDSVAKGVVSEVS